MTPAAGPPPGSPDSGRWTIPAGRGAERLDRARAAHLDLPRNKVQRWIRDGRVEVDGRTAGKVSTEVGAGAVVAWVAPSPEPSGLIAEAGELSILWEDADLAVIDKPPGLTVHPGAGRPRATLVHRLLARYPEIEGVGGPGRPGIVHRLDRDTSGALVVARTERAYSRLAADFAARRVRKTYLAIVHGRPREASGWIEAAIGRHPVERQRMAVARRGRAARTGYRVAASAGPVSLLELALETGRTHQIRVHLKHLGHPLVGDPVYGEARHRALAAPVAKVLASFSRPALHSWKLALRHPGDEREIAVRAPVPEDLRELWRRATGADWPAIA